MNSVKVRFFILKIITQGDSNLVVHALNRDGARMHLVAPGAKRSKKRFGGGILQPTHYVEGLVRPARREGELDLLLEANLIDDFTGLRANYDKLTLSLKIIKLIWFMSQEGSVHDKKLFDLLGNTLKGLITIKETKHYLTHFQTKLLSTQGVLDPQFTESNIMKVSMLEHDHLKLPEEEWHQAQSYCQHHLSMYLQGLHE